MPGMVIGKSLLRGFFGNVARSIDTIIEASQNKEATAPIYKVSDASLPSLSKSSVAVKERILYAIGFAFARRYFSASAFHRPLCALQSSSSFANIGSLSPSLPKSSMAISGRSMWL